MITILSHAMIAYYNLHMGNRANDKYALHLENNGSIMDLRNVGIDITSVSKDRAGDT